MSAAALIRHFNTPERIFFAKAEEFQDIEGVRSADITRLTGKNLNSANKTLAQCIELGYRIITLQDAEYPERLRNIYDPPTVLYVRGHLPTIDEEPVVAVVGTRKCTPYGINAAENIGYRLAHSGLIVITGLARGIDSAVARGALRGGGRVIGVIGSGLDIVYPPENRSLFDDVAASGAVVSEYPPGSAAIAAHFPARNRIISGMSIGVAVIEAPEKSGALITASIALEQGKDVFALPGNVDAKSCTGSNNLLREGAIPILSGDDIIDEYADLFPDKILRDGSGFSHRSAPGYAGTMKQRQLEHSQKEIDNEREEEYIGLDKIANVLDGDEKTIAEAIARKAMHVDDLVSVSGLSAQQVLTSLTMLEIKGYARLADGLWKLGIRN